jgi:hypothetical protein
MVTNSVIAALTAVAIKVCLSIILLQNLQSPGASFAAGFNSALNLLVDGGCAGSGSYSLFPDFLSGPFLSHELITQPCYLLFKRLLSCLLFIYLGEEQAIYFPGSSPDPSMTASSCSWTSIASH